MPNQLEFRFGRLSCRMGAPAELSREAIPVRPDWLYRVVRQCQILAGRLAQAEATDVRVLPDEFPPSATTLEAWILRGLLADCCERCHSASTIDWKAVTRDSVVTSHSVNGPPCADLGHEIRQFIEAHYAEPLTLRRLSRSVHGSKTRVTEAFRRLYRSSVHEYLTAVRVRKAIDELRQSDDKIEVIAAKVGYRSKKNMYHAIRKLTGLTPGAIRGHARQG
jgi:AraC-like DNA-binding protein